MGPRASVATEQAVKNIRAADLSRTEHAGDARAKDAGEKFEAMYLRQMLEECLPKDSESLFGEGTSGTVWRSMLADSLATTLAKSGTIGLGKMVIQAENNPSKDK
ncbi:flagellar biosynthesis protein FlgJ [Hyphomicrobium methylovorum]|nr:flagellar biosynthesis protein FlgJ [Hyphomicrobium methylovorum]